MSTAEINFKNPVIAISSAQISDDMKFVQLTGKESLGRLFVIDLEFTTTNSSISVTDLLDTPMGVSLTASNGRQRFFHGRVASFSYVRAIDEADGTKRHLYRAILRPRAWALTRCSDCQIYQTKSASDIIEAVLKAAGLSAGDDYKLSLSGTYQPRDYCVQYRETSFNFISRLMEEEGIYYFFQFADGKHTMVLCDSPSAHSTVDGYDTFGYFPPDQQPRPDHVNQWEFSGEVQPGKYTIRDYNFLKPDLLLESKSQGSAFTSYEIYDYPGIYQESADGDTRVAVRLGEMQAGGAQATGGGPVLGLSNGALFTLQAHPRADQNKKYLVVSTIFIMESDEFRESAGKGAGPGFHVDFVAIDSSTQFRPPRLTPKPFVQGPQTALVVGPSGDDDIYTNENGCIKVQFYWDRLGKKDENSSCWIRVASPWAGNGWGAIQLPRIKQEVIVDFLEGDPDKPIVTGRVYNADNALPYTLPGEKTKSTIKSRSSTGGTADTFNELRFEDKKDSEEIYFHAEKDFTREVENNDTLTVGMDKKDKGDQTITIYNNRTVTVGNSNSADGSHTETIYNNRTATLTNGNEKLEVQTGNRDVIVTKGTDTHTISAGDRVVKIDKGADKLTVTAGDQTIEITAGKSTTTAGTSIELTVGSSSIKIEAAKITISSAEIDIQGTAKVATSAPMIQESADANLVLKGGVIKIN